MRDYTQFLERLFNARQGGIKPGLERIRRCLQVLGHPETSYAARVHIGGTNGKGSTAAFVESMVRASGVRTGRYTSPHLSRYCERFCIDGEPAEPAEIMAAGHEVMRAGPPDMSFFELSTAIALCLFARAGVHTAVIEVGMGGRLDSTNVLPAEVAVVTGVALDHERVLGSNVAEIAAEKAGIFKPGQRVVIGRAGEPEAVPVLVARARAAGVAALTVVDEPASTDWQLGLFGEHQRDNAAAALAAMDHLDVLGLVAATPEQRGQGLLGARMPGRLETVATSPRVIVDGAHNPHAARMLSRFMATLAPRPVLVLGVSSGKDMAGIVRSLVEHAAAVVVTQASMERAAPAAELAQVVAPIMAEKTPGVGLCVIADAITALAQARSLAGPEGVVMVAGSLFVAGEVRQHVRGEAGDAVRLSDPFHIGASEPSEPMSKPRVDPRRPDKTAP